MLHDELSRQTERILLFSSSAKDALESKTNFYIREKHKGNKVLTYFFVRDKGNQPFDKQDKYLGLAKSNVGDTLFSFKTIKKKFFFYRTIVKMKLYFLCYFIPI